MLVLKRPRRYYSDPPRRYGYNSSSPPACGLNVDKSYFKVGNIIVRIKTLSPSHECLRIIILIGKMNTVLITLTKNRFTDLFMLKYMSAITIKTVCIARINTLV